MNLTKKQQDEMQEVVKAMPGVFETTSGADIGYAWEDFSGSKHVYKSMGDGSSEIKVSPAQHAVWVCDRLMEWLEDEEKRGYSFEYIKRQYHGTCRAKWSVVNTKNNSNRWLTGNTFSSLWDCLFSAWKHWQEQQEPKEARCSVCGGDHAEVQQKPEEKG